ncbi:MAG TPA: BON domain-containing protein [Nevskiaceae bacterium]|nr:BON domain-containing protein [Nevskiaceae bacterium]
MNSAEPISNLPASPRIARPLPPSADGAARDAYIAGRLVTAYALCEQLAPFRLSVEVRDGVVMLSGVVDDKVLRDLALEIAQELDGVREVRNQVAVEIGAPHAIGPGDAFARRFDNAQLAAGVRTRLLWNGATHGAGIEVSAEDGTITLTGSVANAQVRELAGRLAAEVRGTVQIDNRLQVRTGN